MDKEELIKGLEQQIAENGEWAYDIPLPFDVWTRGNMKVPHTRLRRIVQTVSDLVNKPLSECRILDLGCLDGIFSIEFAQQGAKTIGIEVRDVNINKARFCKEALGLDNLELHQGDARDISEEKFGRFDAIICSGLLYHLTAKDAIDLIAKMHDMCDKCIVLDTHIALKGEEVYSDGTNEFYGWSYHEHNEQDTQEVKSQRLWASWDNNYSFWFTRPSLINAINQAGFSSVYECFTPIHLNFGQPGIEHLDRCTFVAVKGKPVQLTTSPVVNELSERWPENSLGYNPEDMKQTKTVHNKFKSRLKRILKK